MTTPPPILLDSYDLEAAERLLCVRALEIGGSIVEAAKLLRITRHALKRRIVKHKITWTRATGDRPLSENEDTGG